MTPAISIVIAAWNGPVALRNCLDSLPEAADGTAEVIVARNFADDAPPVQLGHLFLKPIVLEGRPVPELRAAGVAAATAPLVALTEDHCLFDPGWLDAMLAAEPCAALGGAVENVAAGRSGLDWAVYFYDYGRHLRPRGDAPRPARMLPGNNVRYRRTDLEKVAASFTDGFVETGVNAAILKSGGTLEFYPAAVVLHAKRYRLAPAAREAFNHGRIHGGGRPQALPRGLVGAALLPLLTPARVVSALIRGRRADLAGPLLRALTPLVFLAGCWGAGEILGYLGGPGNSHEHWK